MRHFLQGLTYGPFGPEEENAGLPPLATVQRDLGLIREWGGNTVRLYHVPPEWFLDECGNRGLQVLASIPWTDHTDFLRSRAETQAVLKRVRQSAAAVAGRPEVAALLVGNEIQSTLVRWLGARRVQHFLDDLLDTVHQAAPDTLAGYANYPGTEFLQPLQADFTAFNVYLEDRDACDRYFARLQNIAGDKPLLISEFGVDAAHHGPDRQAEILLWQRRLCLEHGVAGNLLFSFTDEWHRGGEDVTAWSFGLTNREREPRTAWHALAGGPPLPSDLLPEHPPRVSVIVCTRNGARTLTDCLESLKALHYPDYEIILVDDGSTDGVPHIASECTGIRYIRQEPAGLAVARNTGAAAATGDILAWTDDDCVVDPDWLIHLTWAMRDEGTAAAGGPNIPPPATSLSQACVTATPGGPAHVLLTDRTAEHIPGCNMAVRRAAFDSIHGFRPKYHAAGDDVDFCWRLLEAGGAIAFSAPAMVWHFRRTTTSAFLRQQGGYGKAEALLMARHSARFGQIGGARWHGTVYQSGLLHLMLRGSRIYTGVFGYAPFQAIYRTPLSEASWIVTSFPWWLLAFAFLANGLWLPPLLIPGALMVLFTLTSTLRQARALHIPRPWDGWSARLLLWFLLLAQPLVRGWARFVWNLRLGSAPGGPWIPQPSRPGRRSGLAKRVAEVACWSDDGLDRDTLLPLLRERFRSVQTGVDDGWRDWDLELAPSLFWRVRLATLTEYHARHGRLTRVRVASRATWATFLLHLLIAVLSAALVPIASFHILWAVGVFFGWTVLFEIVHYRAVARTIAAITTTAAAAGFRPVREPAAAE